MFSTTVAICKTKHWAGFLLLMTQNWEEWLKRQMAVLPFTGTSTGWKNGLTGIPFNRVSANCCTGMNNPCWGSPKYLSIFGDTKTIQIWLCTTGSRWSCLSKGGWTRWLPEPLLTSVILSSCNAYCLLLSPCLDLFKKNESQLLLSLLNFRPNSLETSVFTLVH